MKLEGGLRPPFDGRRALDGALLPASPQDGIARAKPALEHHESTALSSEDHLQEGGGEAGEEVKVDRTALEEFGRADGRKSRTVFEAYTQTTGRVRVVDYRNERRLIVSGDILSIYPLDEDWDRLKKEYWWHALAAVGMPPRPRVLLVGLGGGTQVHMLQRLARPREITVIERDPVIVRVACDWFGLRRVGGLEFLCGDATRIVPWLTQVGRRFDFIMEDAAYAAPPEVGLPLAQALVPLLAPGGRLVINRHLRGDGRQVAAALRPHFADVRVRRVRRDGENVLVCCSKQPVAQRAGRRL